jgi:hypothetical protein
VNCQPWIKLLSTQQKIKKNKFGEKGKRTRQKGKTFTAKEQKDKRIWTNE